MYSATLQILNVTVEDAGKYKVTAKNELGESNATISLNFDSKYLPTTNLSCLELLIVESHPWTSNVIRATKILFKMLSSLIVRPAVT